MTDIDTRLKSLRFAARPRERPRSLDVLPSRYRVRDPRPARVPLPPLRAAKRRRRRPLDTHGRDQPADRALAGILLGLHPAAQPGGLAGRPGPDQRPAEAGARIPRYPRADTEEIHAAAGAARAPPSAGACARPRRDALLSEERLRDRRHSRRTACSSPSPRRRSSTSCSTRATTGCAAGSTASTPRTIGSRITMSQTVEEWAAEMAAVFRELYRVTRPRRLGGVRGRRGAARRR